MSALDLLKQMHARSRWLDPSYIGSDLHAAVKAAIESKKVKS